MYKDFPDADKEIHIRPFDGSADRSQNTFKHFKDLFHYTDNARKKRQIPVNRKNHLNSDDSFVKNLLKKSPGSKCAAPPPNNQHNSNRPKRNIDELDPLNNPGVIYPPPEIGRPNVDYKRDKRRAQEQLNFLEQEYTRCSRNADSSANCDDIYQKFVALTKQVNEQFSAFANDFKQIRKGGKKLSEEHDYHKMPDQTKDKVKVTVTTEVPPSTTTKDAPIPKKLDNRDESDLARQTYLGDGFYYSYQHPPKVHEDLTDDAKKGHGADAHLSNRQGMQHDVKNEQAAKNTDTGNAAKTPDVTGNLYLCHLYI